MKPLFVAEVSSNHNRNLSRCFDFIDKAAEVGCGAIKFQLFRIDELFAPEILKKSEEHRRRKQWELPVEFLGPLAGRCRQKNIQFACTPFYLAAVKELLPYVDFYKIASYELLWKELLAACARTGKPIVVSTGMATLDEIDTAVRTLIGEGCRELTMLHCVSGYPTPLPECNLAAIRSLRSTFHLSPLTFHLKFGWSDHSMQPAVIYRAIHHWNASVIEFHLDLDGTGDEYKAGHCWLPDQIKLVIEAVNAGFEADGTGEKLPAASEKADRDWRADPSDGLRPLLKTRMKWRS
jgi:sialic acid synthase SpsE